MSVSPIHLLLVIGFIGVYFVPLKFIFSHLVKITSKDGNEKPQRSTIQILNILLQIPVLLAISAFVSIIVGYLCLFFIGAALYYTFETWDTSTYSQSSWNIRLSNYGWYIFSIIGFLLPLFALFIRIKTAGFSFQKFYKTSIIVITLGLSLIISGITFGIIYGEANNRGPPNFQAFLATVISLVGLVISVIGLNYFLKYRKLIDKKQ